MFDPIKPHFEYNKRSAFMSYHCADIINEFINEYQDNYQPIINKLYSYFPIIIKKHKYYTQQFRFFKLNDFEVSAREVMDSITDDYTINSYAQSRDGGGISMVYDGNSYTHGTLRAFKTLYPDYAERLKNAYREAIKNDEHAGVISSKIDEKIKFIKQWAIDNHQIRETNAKGQFVDNKNIKKFNDLNISAYYVNENTLNFFCSGSSTIYSCVFSEDGYKLYGTVSASLFETERNLFPDTEIDEDEGFDRLLLKHAINDDYLVMENSNGEIIPYDDLILCFKYIVSAIYDKEISKK